MSTVDPLGLEGLEGDGWITAPCPAGIFFKKARARLCSAVDEIDATGRNRDLSELASQVREPNPTEKTLALESGLSPISLAQSPL